MSNDVRWIGSIDGSSSMVAGVMVLLLMSTVTVSSAVADENSDGDELDDDIEIVEHVVDDDETLGTVALEHEVNVVDLMEWNDVEEVGEIEADEELEVRIDDEPEGTSGPEPVVHVVNQGDTFEGIANRYGVTTTQLRNWNGNANPRRLQIGQQLRLHVPGSDGRPVSYGSPNSGRLFNGVPMESSPGLRVRNVSRSYGTQRTVDLLKAAGADVQARWPDAPELVVGSLSFRRGGPIAPHRSHQSGRDADLSYYHRGNAELEDFRDMTPEKFDAVKNWHFFKTLIATGEVEYIFVDYELQRVLYEYALSIGYDEQDLEEIMQYPRGRRVGVGIIRHASGHENHFHIRFTCGEHDQNCR